MTQALVEVDGLRFRWPRGQADTLAIAHFSLQPGETVFLRGPSGSGKSTLLSLLAGVLLAREGRVALMGRDWREMSGPARDAWRAQHVGYIFQQFNLLPYRSAFENAMLPLRFSPARAARAPDARNRVASMLGQMGLTEADWKRPAGELSVGQQQRVAAVRALIGEPALVVADEPTSALDEALRDQFMTLLLSAVRQAGSGLLFVSHDARLGVHFDRQLDLAALQQEVPA
ncbi:MAG: ABC transporter ATP-binding protein [Roseateles sp.]